MHRKCDQIQCTRTSHLWKLFWGCGHSFHVECILPHLDVCHVCEETLKSRVASLGRKANEAVLNGSFGDQEDEDVVVSSVQEDDADVDDDTPDIDDDLLGSEEE